MGPSLEATRKLTAACLEITTFCGTIAYIFELNAETRKTSVKSTF
ncbi:hypothetical protein [Paenibacillus germinis]|nr:hypothetical protein [Paenibacillus germinis]